MNKILIGLLAVAGAGALGALSLSFFTADEPEAGDWSEWILFKGQSRFLSADDPVTDETAPKLGYLAPEFDLQDLNGTERALSDYRGKPVLLNFWATWCPSCRSEMPALDDCADAHPEVPVLGVNWGQKLQSVPDFLEELDVGFTNLSDARGTAFVSYQLTGVPSTFFLDAQGYIRGVWLGPMSEQEIEAAFARIAQRGEAL